MARGAAQKEAGKPCRQRVGREPGYELIRPETQRHDGNRARAALLANAYAKQYTVFRSQLDTQAYLQARANVLTRVAELNGQGRTADARSLNSPERSRRRRGGFRPRVANDLSANTGPNLGG